MLTTEHYGFGRVPFGWSLTAVGFQTDSAILRLLNSERIVRVRTASLDDDGYFVYSNRRLVWFLERQPTGRGNSRPCQLVGTSTQRAARNTRLAQKRTFSTFSERGMWMKGGGAKGGCCWLAFSTFVSTFDCNIFMTLPYLRA